MCPLMGGGPSPAWQGRAGAPGAGELGHSGALEAYRPELLSQVYSQLYVLKNRKL